MNWKSLEQIRQYKEVGSLDYRIWHQCYVSNNYSMCDDKTWVDRFIKDLKQLQVKVSELHMKASYLKKILRWREYNPLSKFSMFNK